MKQSTSNKILMSLALFIIVCSLSAILGWLSGFNFDRRSSEVAMWSFTTLVFAGFAGLIPHVND